MMRKWSYAGILIGVILLGLAPAAQGEIATLEFNDADIAAFTTAREDLGECHVLRFSIPKNVIAKRLDMVHLELYVDVALNTDAPEWATPVVEILPLVAEFAGDGIPEFGRSSTAVQNVVPGQKRRLMLDITQIVRAWIASPETNHGLIIGTLTGPREGTFTLRDDTLGGGKVAKVTFVYQNRFGEPVSH